jgi:hypothetical protein
VSKHLVKMVFLEGEIKMSNSSGYPGFPKEDLTQKRETVGSSKTDRFMSAKYRAMNRNAQSGLTSAMNNDGDTRKK